MKKNQWEKKCSSATSQSLICQWVINVISRGYARLAPFVPIQEESLWNWNWVLLISYHTGWLVLRLFLIRIWKYNLSITIWLRCSVGDATLKVKPIYIYIYSIYIYTVKNKGSLLASMFLWRTLNIHGTFQMQKRFFIVEKDSLDF